MEEYASLRNEIISLEELQRNVWIYMYVLFCTLFVLGLQWSHYLFLVTYIVLIPFQCVINDFLWAISKISTYIRIFYETDNHNMNWESFHFDDGYRAYYSKKSNSLVDLIRISSAIHLGALATSFFCGSTLIRNYAEGRFVLNGLDIFLIITSIVLFGITLQINYNYNKKYHNELEKITNQYRLKVVKKNQE